MPELNLNAKRAERAARRGSPMMVVLGEPPQSFELVPEVPLAVGELAAKADIAGAMRLLLRNPDVDWPRLSELGLSMEDVNEVVNFYGANLGESSASSSSSTNTGTPSRPISNASTALTSPTPVSVGEQSTLGG